MKLEAKREAANRAQQNAFNSLLEFVRNCRRNGWDPTAFVPPVAFGLADAIRHAAAFDELTKDELWFLGRE